MDRPLAKLERVSDDERRLLDAYRNLEREGRERLLELAQLYAGRMLDRRPRASVVLLQPVPR